MTSTIVYNVVNFIIFLNTSESSTEAIEMSAKTAEKLLTELASLGEDGKVTVNHCRYASKGSNYLADIGH